jgi:hypothetical protein
MSQKTAADIATILRDPDKPFGAASQLISRVRALSRDSHGALIPARAVTGSPASVRSFIADWNSYTLLVARALDGYVAEFEGVVSLKEPTMLFLRQARDAFLSRDSAAYQSARSAFVGAMRRLPASVFSPSTGNLGNAEQSAAKRLVDDANHSDDVLRLVDAVKHDYPASLFVQRFKQ